MGSAKLSNLVKIMLQSSGMKSATLAELLEISPQSLTNKFSRGSFSVDDLIKIAAFTDFKLSMKSASGDINIILDKDYITPGKEVANLEHLEDPEDIIDFVALERAERLKESEKLEESEGYEDIGENNPDEDGHLFPFS